MTLHGATTFRDTVVVVISWISVGVDTSQTSLDALTWSLGLAKESGANVRAVTTWERSLVRGLRQLVTGTPSEVDRSRQSREHITAALEQAHITTDVETVVLNAAPGPALAAESERADLLVIGRTGRGFGRTEQLIVGSVARYCMHFARGHVAVVPRKAVWNRAPTVVVGIDGSANSIDALKWAIDNMPAAATICAVRAETPTFGDAVRTNTDSFQEMMASANRELQRNIDEATTSTTARTSAIIAHVEAGGARDVLLRPELGADLIVVGTHDRTGAIATLLGSVPGHVARHATCPVVIVRPQGSSNGMERDQ